MRISKLNFKAGSGVGMAPLQLNAGVVNVFVGPNYSGKSQAVAEIANRLNNGDAPHSRVVLEEIEIEGYSEGDALLVMDSMERAPRAKDNIQPGHKFYGFRDSRFMASPETMKSVLMNPLIHKHEYAHWYARYKTLVLNGANRIALVDDQATGDLQSEAKSSLQHIFRDDELRSHLSQIVHAAFGLYLVIDPTNVGQLRIRLSNSPPPSPELERGLSKESIEFHGKATLISESSDGTKAFVGIMSQILAGDPRILLIDEPEAFLHPSLAFELGRVIAGELGRNQKQMFVSTHSAHFVMGCLQSGVDVNIIRLTFRDNIATARLLSSNDLKSLMRNPLLRSANVVSALFHESVVVTESDSDRAFYQEINERLLRSNAARGIQNAIFLNAQNKQTIPTILAPLRRLGIPAAAIYDIDLLKDGGGVATSFLASAGVPNLSQQSITSLRLSVLNALNAKAPDFKRRGGISLLEGGDLEAAQMLLEQLQSYGAFIVPGGELENWLSEFGIAGHGPGWLIPMFERLGEDPGSCEYVSPGEGDVWLFLERIRHWLHDPNRKGIPH